MGTLRYDLVVLGSGPAGEKGAAQAAYFGKRVALVEERPELGGAAANTGTLPSKTLRETSLVLSGFRARGLYGVDLSLRRQAKVEDLLRRERQVVATERARAEANVARHGIDRYHGRGSFVDPHTVRVEREGKEPILLESAVILIATGSSPRRPPVFPWGHPAVHDSDTILSMSRLPSSLAVVGGGVIGCEYACTFAALDIEVTLIDAGDLPLRFLDGELSRALKDAMTHRLGIHMRMPDRVAGCEADEDRLRIALDSIATIDVEAVLVAAGRTSNTAGLDLEAAGLGTGDRGLLEVDARYRTAVPHIYAAGDVVGFPALASTSMEQARLAMVDAFHLEYKKEVAPVLPYGIYTIPEVSMVGETEESLREKGVGYVVGRAAYRENPRGIIIGDQEGFLKLLFRREDMRLLGVHALGEQATELVHVGVAALLMEASSELFIRMCFNYPTLGDLYKYATYDAMGRRQREAEAREEGGPEAGSRGEPPLDAPVPPLGG